MIEVMLATLLVVSLIVALAAYVRWAPDPTVPETVLVRLYRIRKRMELAQFKLEVRRDADRVHRELREDLHGMRRRP